MIKTEQDLKDEWGQVRFVQALGFLSGWYIEKGILQTQEQMQSLADENKDAFEVFVSRMLYNVA